MIKNSLYEFVEIVIDEAERNPEFKERVEKALEGREYISKNMIESSGGRGEKPTINPIDAVEHGEEVLIQVLNGMEVKELKNIIKYYAMDIYGVSTRWKKKDRLINLIVEFSLLKNKK